MRYTVVTDSEVARHGGENTQGLGVHWARLLDETLFWGSAKSWSDFEERMGRGGTAIAPAGELQGHPYLIVQVGRAFQDEFPNVPVVVRKGRYLIADLDPAEAQRLTTDEETCWGLQPIAVDTVMLDLIAPTARVVVPWVQTLLADLSQSRYSETLDALTAFPTRHSLSTHFADAADLVRTEPNRNPAPSGRFFSANRLRAATLWVVGGCSAAHQAVHERA